MRLKAIALAALVIAAPLAARDLVPQITFDTLVVDLGTFAEADGPQNCSFSFTNTGTAPLIINQARASCGCTVPTWPTDPILPGGHGLILVTYNGEGKHPGRFRKTVTIQSNAPDGITRLTVQGFMKE